MTLEKISRRFLERHPADAVRIIEQLDEDERSALIKTLEPVTAAAMLQAMTPADAAACLALMAPARSVPVLGHMPTGFAAACLRRLPGDERRAVLVEAGAGDELKQVRTLLSFPPDVVGALMDPDSAAVQEQMSCNEAVEFARRYPEKLRNVIYVVNGDNVLTGRLEARDLLILQTRSSIHSAMKPVQYSLNARAYLHNVRDNPGWEHFEDLPVVDYHGTYLGSLNRETFLQALAQADVTAISADQPKEILIGLAETFLNTCSELLFPNKK